jgi:hypothetical protein
MPTTEPFLRADWRWLLLMNYRVDPQLVLPLVPAGCELDLVDGETFVSVVGFLFQNTRLKGVPVPFHQHFEEVNLRFYIRRDVDGEVRRAVGFVKEIVPRWAIATVARVLYNESYVDLPMRHTVDVADGTLVEGARVSYGWETGDRWHDMSARIAGPPRPLAPGSHEQFIAEHYWGYAAQRDGGTVEYRVEHPPWRAFPVTEAHLDVDVAAIWGPVWAQVLARPPVSVFVAEGSGVSVSDGRRVG